MLRVRFRYIRKSAWIKTERRFLKTCITGIGNPEPKYAGTRHNAGLTMLDLIRNKLITQTELINYKPCSEAPAKYLNASPDLLLIRADGDFINLSGKTVVPLWKKLERHGRITHVVAHDELSLPLGKVQLRRPETSLRGHNGLKSIQNCLGSNEFYRLAVGIGRPDDRSPAIVSDYVLGKFTPQESEILETASLQRALQLLKQVL